MSTRLRLLPTICSRLPAYLTYTAYMYLGSMVEYGKTDEIFIKPKRKETEDYITGRFG